MDILMWVLVAGVVVGLAILAYVMLMRALRGPKVEEYLHFRCPGCKRRLRFHGSQTGHAGQCSHCGGKLTFPQASQTSD
jgi:hypothetical protein